MQTDASQSAIAEKSRPEKTKSSVYPKVTTLTHDARRKLEEGWQLSQELMCHELLYPDDTLIIDSNKGAVLSYTLAISETGKSLGPSSSWSQIEVLVLRADCDIRAPDGQLIKKKQSTQCLGSTLVSDGHLHHELVRKLGSATADFSVLQRLWNQSTLNINRKLQIFGRCVLSKLP